ncbi:TlpA family protein disulfide reductase [Marininema halotolerans]|uniref:Thiol-disulfide isomerase or thioredoxin n=1 Tax=Marininema halotolerans TaxID=1155944 RepID=A0A1I6QBE4_9BACL|nr:TlpA disulfide reductase family protein [Marininema halotolerans]SFS49610.1 Thiol-disulfide isomerase or thioredoxin [Marininema halotolerans]
MGQGVKRYKNVMIGSLLVIALGIALWTGLPKEKKGMNSQQAKAVHSSSTKEAEKGNAESRLFGENQLVRASEGKQLPNITLATMDGKHAKLIPGKKPTLINLWASWCPPCQEEMPHLQKAYNQYNDQMNFSMVNLTKLDSVKKAKEYLKQGNYTFPVLLDEHGDVGEALEVINIPQTYIVDKDGVILYHINGMLNKEQLNYLLKKITS